MPHALDLRTGLLLIAVLVLHGAVGVGAKVSDGSCAPKVKKSRAPHLFASPPTFRQFVKKPVLAKDEDGKQAANPQNELNWLTNQDVKHIVAEKAALRAAPTPDELSACTIQRVSKRMEFSQFLKKYRDTPAIISADAKIAALPFDVTSAKFVAKHIPSGQLNPCLCRPQYGTNFHDTSAQAVCTAAAPAVAPWLNETDGRGSALNAPPRCRRT